MCSEQGPERKKYMQKLSSFLTDRLYCTEKFFLEGWWVNEWMNEGQIGSAGSITHRWTSVPRKFSWEVSWPARHTSQVCLSKARESLLELSWLKTVQHFITGISHECWFSSAPHTFNTPVSGFLASPSTSPVPHLPPPGPCRGRRCILQWRSPCRVGIKPRGWETPALLRDPHFSASHVHVIAVAQSDMTSEADSLPVWVWEGGRQNCAWNHFPAKCRGWFLPQLGQPSSPFSWASAF